MTQSPRRSPRYRFCRKTAGRRPPPALEPGGNNVERIDIMSQPVNDDAIDFFEID
jgi:hypothetical protein